MSTFLFPDTIFGPVVSRRLGISLGVNLLPTASKFCNFNCIYCECGWTKHQGKPLLPSRSFIHAQLVQRLQERAHNGEKLDVITFAGNGEPTIHPLFPEIIADTLEVRNRYFPSARIVVLSNATMLHQAKVVAALKKVDQAVLKLDSARNPTMQLIDGPQMSLTVEQIVERLHNFGHEYTLQTLFLTGSHNGQIVDNTTPEELDAWLEKVAYLRPRDVMIYTIDRDTPEADLHKVPLAQLEAIARRVDALGISTQVRG